MELSRGPDQAFDDQGLVLATIPDHHFDSGSSSKPNRCQIGDPGCQ